MTAQAGKLEMGYGLTWNPNPPVTVPQLVTYAMAAGVYTILAWVSVVSAPIQIPGVGALFIAMGFGVPFTLWFGGWGLVIGFIGTSIGAGILTGLPLPIALAFGVGDVILFGSLLVLYRGLARRFGVDPLGRDVYTGKGFLFFFLVAGNIPHILGGIYGIIVLYNVGFIPPDAIPVAFAGLWLGNVIVVTIISSIVLRLLSPVVERLGLTSYGWVT
ncbi:MAG TPA: hypothetical protein VJK02_07270 [Anaerolineales bacterium]|nr:hypothetical protein [Anaerolineales bacterium]